MAREDRFTYRFNGQEISLPVEEGAVSVAAEAVAANRTALTEALRLDADVEASALGADWSRFKSKKDKGLKGRDLAVTLINQGAAFVSPVLKDQKGRDMYISQTLNVLIPYKLGEKQKAKLLGGVKGVQSYRLVSSPVSTAWIPPGNPSGEVTYRELAGNPDGYEVYQVSLDTKNGFEVLDEAERLGAISGIACAEPAYILTAQSAQVAIPNDPQYANQWHLQQAVAFLNPNNTWTIYNSGLNALAAWNSGFGYSSVKVAVLDSGIDLGHPDLPVAGGKNFTNEGAATAYGATEEFENHGTLVAGVINAAVNNGVGIAGLSPNVRVYSLKIGKKYTADNSFESDVTWIQNAINWCVSNDIRVTNSSFGFETYIAAIDQAYANARAAEGIIHVAAAGNDGASSISFPASSSSVIAVGSTNKKAERSAFSNMGSGLDIMAPGESILTADRVGAAGESVGDYHTDKGTSFSSPLVAATAALMLSRNPGLSPAQVESALTSTASRLGAAPYPNATFGYGLVRPASAIAANVAGVFPAAGFVNDAGGWKMQTTFGWLNDEKFPDYWHSEHGWQYTTSTDPNNMWLFDIQSNSWWWISIGNGGTYPWIFRNGKWYLYNKGTTSPRWFYDNTAQQWVNF